MFFITKDKRQNNRFIDVIHRRIVCDYWDGKEEQNRTRLTMGGDKINYPGNGGKPTADLLTIKLLLKSVISMPKAKFMTMEIKNFYLNTPLKQYKYLYLKLTDISKDIQQQYELQTKATSEGWVYIEIWKGMYGLPQAGLLAQELLEKCLAKNMYIQSKLTSGLWTHHRRPIQFCLIVNDFGVNTKAKNMQTTYTTSWWNHMK